MVKLIKTKTTDTDLTKSLKQQINEDLGQRYKDKEVISLLDITSVLDPRFKIKYLEKVDEVLAQVKEEGANIVHETRRTQISNDVDDSIMITPEPARKKKKLGTLFKVYEDDVEEARQISPEQVFNTELDNYLSLPQSWMQKKKFYHGGNYIRSSKYPFISQLAQKYLSICATSSASERLFSTSGNVVTPSRSSLKPDKVNMLTFLAKNL